MLGLLDDFRPANVIWVYRHYNDVVNSMRVSFKNQAHQIRKMAEDPTMGGWWLGNGISDETLKTIRKFASPDLDDVNASALQWYLRNVLFFEQGLDKKSQVKLIKYEKLVTQAEHQFENIFNFLKLPYSNHVVNRIDSSSVRKKEPPMLNAEIKKLVDELLSRFDEIEILSNE